MKKCNNYVSVDRYDENCSDNEQHVGGKSKHGLGSATNSIVFHAFIVIVYTEITTFTKSKPIIFLGFDAEGTIAVYSEHGTKVGT